MITFKHAYHYTSDGHPLYTQYKIPSTELLVSIANKQVILSDDIHPFVKKYDPYHMLLSAYILNFTTGEISFDIGIVKNILIFHFRYRRDQILAELDTEQLKCMTNPDNLAKIESVKQQLRDLPTTISTSMGSCINFVDLQSVEPPILTTYKEMI